jgi:catechol 2,3-dioxygenase-like lactoylglutathione lyase family enzyme
MPHATAGHMPSGSVVLTRMKPRLVGINHVALQVDDLEEAVAFYTALFEPTAIDRSEHDAAFLEIGDQFIALFERGSREEQPHFGLVVDDKAATRQRLEEAGVDILPGHRLDFLDPSGNRVQVVQYDQIQFTKTERILEGMDLTMGKSEQALDELRAKNLAD